MMMDLGRRQFFQTALTGAALLAAPALASDVVFVPGTGNAGTGGPSRLLLGRAKAALDLHKSRIRNRDLLAIADFSKASRDPRFYLVNLQSGQSATFLVAHGKGSDPGHSGWVQSFSNSPGSEATSSGSYMVGDTYFGQYGESRRLIGLDPQNDQAEARAIVIHPAWYVSQALIAEQGKIGRSQGCFAFSQGDIGQILERLAPGCLLYADKV
jgi:L,D-transpeptidase catalytic domain